MTTWIWSCPPDQRTTKVVLQRISAQGRVGSRLHTDQKSCPIECSIISLLCNMGQVHLTCLFLPCTLVPKRELIFIFSDLRNYYANLVNEICETWFEEKYPKPYYICLYFTKTVNEGGLQWYGPWSIAVSSVIPLKDAVYFSLVAVTGILRQILPVSGTPGGRATLGGWGHMTWEGHVAVQTRWRCLLSVLEGSVWRAGIGIKV